MADYKRKLTDYFKKNLKKGYTIESLRWALVKQGYSRVFVEEAIKSATKELADEAPVLKNKPEIKYEVVPEETQSVEVQKSWWRRFFGL